MNHDVYSSLDDTNLVVKVFQGTASAEAEREWDALVALAGSDIAPRPVHFDAGDPAIVVMTREPGSSLPATALNAEHARVIGSVHRLVHQTVPKSHRLPRHAHSRAAQIALTAEHAYETPSRQDDVSDVVALARGAAQTWMADVDLRHLLSFGDLCFSRGDPNLNNYLWSDEGLVLIDWEHSGYNDPALEIADMMEHPSAWALSDAFWDQLADATELTQEGRVRVTPARRLMACLWLVTIESREREALPTTVTLDEQAARTLAILNR